VSQKNKIFQRALCLPREREIRHCSIQRALLRIAIRLSSAKGSSGRFYVNVLAEPLCLFSLT
jgi:hypothetical protein